MGALILAALAVAAVPAAPRQVQARLTVQATVLPACTVSTAGDSTTSAHARCSESVGVAVSVATAPVPADSQAGGSAMTKVITLTY